MRPGMLLKANQHFMGWIGGTMLYEWNEDSPNPLGVRAAAINARECNQRLLSLAPGARWRSTRLAITPIQGIHQSFCRR